MIDFCQGAFVTSFDAPFYSIYLHFRKLPHPNLLPARARELTGGSFDASFGAFSNQRSVLSFFVHPDPLPSRARELTGGAFVTSFVELSAISGQPLVIPAKAGIHYKLLDPVFQRDGDWGFVTSFDENTKFYISSLS